MPAMTDLFNLSGLAEPLTREEGLQILERDRYYLGRTRIQSWRLAPQQNA
jgi:hypothetical protein